MNKTRKFLSGKGYMFLVVVFGIFMSNCVYVSSSGISYCAASSESYWYEYISKVELNTGSESSSGSTYSDYTSFVFTTLSLGQQYTLKVTGKANGYYTECVKAWIDFNQDGDFFDSGEEIDMGCYGFSGEYTFSKTFTVPSDAKSGNTKMRVALQWHAPPPSCGTFKWGEVEDYTININDDKTNCPSITNGDFEGGTNGWRFGGHGDHKISSDDKHSGSYSALIGFKDSPTVADGKDYIYQTITIPQNTKPILSFWYRFYSKDLCDYDFFHMRIRDSNGNVKSTVISKCHSGWGLKDTGWIKKEVDLSPYAGQTIQIYFEVENRVDVWLKSWAYVDEVKVECKAEYYDTFRYGRYYSHNIKSYLEEMGYSFTYHGPESWPGKKYVLDRLENNSIFIISAHGHGSNYYLIPHVLLPGRRFIDQNFLNTHAIKTDEIGWKKDQCLIWDIGCPKRNLQGMSLAIIVACSSCKKYYGADRNFCKAFVNAGARAAVGFNRYIYMHHPCVRKGDGCVSYYPADTFVEKIFENLKKGENLNQSCYNAQEFLERNFPPFDEASLCLVGYDCWSIEGDKHLKLR